MVRQRGQLTIPDKLRDWLGWPHAGDVVMVEGNGEEITIKKYTQKSQKEVDWDQIWAHVRLTRSFKSKGHDVSASQFVIEDRERH